MKIKNLDGKWYFLIAVVMIYGFLGIFRFDLFSSSFGFFLEILKKIVPVLAIVFVLMSVTNYFFTPRIISKYFSQKGVLKWVFVVVGGILSTGAIYMWYPLLADLRSKGLSYGLVACFLYNRAIKIPLIPLMIFYFSLKFAIILGVVMIFVSVVQGILINKLMEDKK